jgi:hypothetical protein
LIAVAIILAIFLNRPQASNPSPSSQPKTPSTSQGSSPQLARTALDGLAVKGRAPKTGYARTQFGNGWLLVGSCDTRNIILNRDLADVTIADSCKVASGVLADPYTGTTISFVRGKDTSDLVQIDHVVALSNAWQTGAQLLPADKRIAFANDPLELLAVDGQANQAKGDGDAATWLPANRAFRCQYVARQIAVKVKYQLWVTPAEKQAMANVLSTCSDQKLPAGS